MKLSCLYECTTTGVIAAAPFPMFQVKKKKKRKYFSEDGVVAPVRQPIAIGQNAAYESDIKIKSGYLGITSKKQTSQPKTKVWQSSEKVGHYDEKSVGSFANKNVKANKYDHPGSGNIIRDPMGKQTAGYK